MIRFTCPHCHAVLVAQPKHVGREAPCKNYRKSVRVPEPPVAQVASAPAHSEPPPLQKRAIRGLLLWATGVSLLLIGFALGRMIGHDRPAEQSGFSPGVEVVPEQDQGKGRHRRLWDEDQLSRKLPGLTMKEVRQLLGDPDSAEHHGSGYSNGGPNVTAWRYKKLTCSGTERIWHDWVIIFNFDHVSECYID